MAAAFNLTAELNLRGPSNLSQVVSSIRRELSTVSLDLQINPRTSSAIQGITNNVNTLSAALRNAQSNAAALDSTLRNLASSLGSSATNINNLNQNVNNTTASITNLRNRSRDATNEVEAFGRQAGLAVRRFAAFSTVTGVIYGLSRALSSAYGEFVNFNKEFVRLQQVTNQSAAGLEGLSQEITRLSQGLGVSSQSLLQVSVTLAQAGLSANETKRALEALAKSALAPSFDDLNSTVEGSIALMRQFGISAGDLEASLGSINAVAAKFAVEAGDIIAAIQRTGGVFAAASKGVSEGKDALNEFIAVFTSVRATTRESAETIATGLRTIFTRIQRGGTIEALKEYGIQLTDVQGKFVGAYEAVRRLSDGLSKLDPRDIRFSRIVEELGGFRQIGKVIPLIQQFATAQQALSVAQKGSASLTQDAATAQLALAVRITKVREEFIGLIREIGQSQGFQKFVDISLQLASGLIAVADAAKGVLPALTAIIALRGISNIGTFVGGFSQSLAGNSGRRGGRRGFASGGFVPGVGNGDTVPAMLTPGEFVIRKKAVQTIGVGKLAALNRSSGGYIPTQNFQSGGRVQKFARGGSSRRLGVFDFDMTTGVTRQKETPSLSGFRNPKLAVPDILSASPTGLLELMKKYGASSVLTARSGGPRGEMRTALGSFFRKNGILVPSNQLITLGDQVGELSTAEKKARALHAMVKKYGRIDFFDDDIKNIEAAKMVKGVDARRVKIRKSLGGYIQKFAQPVATPGSGRVKDIPYYRDRPQVKEAIRKSGGSVRMFGLASLSGGAGKRSVFKQTLLAKPKGMEPVPVTIRVGSLSKQNSDLATKIDSDIKTQFGASIKKTAKQLASLLKSQVKSSVPFEKVINNSGFQQVVGSVFEGALNMIGAPFFEKSEATKSMDFPFGLGAAASLFNIPGNIPTDATRTAGSAGKGPNTMIKQIERYLEAENKGLYSQKLQAIKSQGGAASTSDEVRRLVQNPEDKQAISDIFSKSRIAAIPRFRAEKTTNKYFNTTLPLALSNNPGVLSEVQEYIRRKKGTVRRAAGGGISGQDTVPALLTPGEFVINKKAARRLGSSKLNRLNRADKIQGFNSGGAVGNIPTFAGGGMMEASFRALERVVTSLTRSLQNFGRRTQQTGLMPAGGGSVLNRARSLRARGLEGDDFRSAMRREGFAKNLMKDPMTLMFGAGMMGDMISKSGSPALGAAVTGGASAAGVMATLAPMIGLTGPFGALLTVTTGLVAAYSDYQQALKDIIIAENTKKLETETALLEGAFQRLTRTSKITAESFNEIQSILSNMQIYSDSIVRAQVEKATPSSLAVTGGNILDVLLSGSATLGFSALSLLSGLTSLGTGGRMGRRGFFNPTTKIDTGFSTIGKQQQSELSANIYTASKPMADAASRSISEIMTRTGKSFEQAVSTASGGDPNRRAGILRSIAIAQFGDRIPQLEARREAVKSQFVAGQLSEEDYALKLQEINQTIANTTDVAVKAFAQEAREKQKVVKATYAVINSVNAFNEALKNISAGVDRASAQFAESVRVMDIRSGGPGQIGGPSRMNENIIGNLRAYSAQEVSSAIGSLGSTLGLDRGFVQQTTQNLLIQQQLEKQLPTIFGRLAGMQRSPGGGPPDALKQELTKLFAPLKLDPSTLQKVIEELEGNFNELANSGSNVSLDELANKSDTLKKVIEGFTNSQKTALDIAKGLNDVQSTLSQKLTEYVSKLELAIEAQIRASSIREQGAIDLKEAMGQSVSLAERNAVFDNSIRSLTAQVNNRGNISAGTGTTDPNIIAARLRAAENRRIQLEEKKTAQGGELSTADALELSRVNLQAKNFEKALERLSNDTTKAAAALQEIQKIRQAQQGRSNMFMDFISNINNPDWMMELAMNTARYRGVMTGDRRATIRDLPGARQGLEFATQGMTSEQATEARQRFQREALKILMRPLDQGGMGLDRRRAEALYGQIAGDPEGQMRSAIDLYNEAINNQATATEEFGKIAKSAGQKLYDDIVAAGEAFAASVRGSVAANAPIVPGAKANGGLIYANKGRYVDYKPRGTDTVPAMLTPGEFVVNARATKKNLGLLKAINSGSKGYSKGGLVYLQDGGFVSSVDEEISSIQQQINEFDAETERLAQEIGLSREQGLKIGLIGLLERIGILRDAREQERRPLDEKLMLLQTTRQYEVDQNTAKQNFDKEAAARKAEESIPLVIPEDDREARKQQLVAQQEQEFNANKTRAERRIGAYEKWQRDKQAEQQAAEARKTPRERYQEAKKAEMDRRKAAFEADKEARRSRFLANNPRFAEKEEERKTREDIEKEQALKWWNTTGRWDQNQDIPAAQYTPDDVVKRYKKATLAERIEINNAELRVRQQRDRAAMARPGPVKPKPTGPIVAADIFNEGDMAQQARADQAGRMYWSQLMLSGGKLDGTYYKDVGPNDQELIYQDLMKGRPVGYNSLKPRQQQDLDLYIERWIRDYEAKQTQDFKASQQTQAAAQEEAEKRASEERAIAIRAETETRRKADKERERAINDKARLEANLEVAGIQSRSEATLEERKARMLEESRANLSGGPGSRRLKQTLQERKDAEEARRAALENVATVMQRGLQRPVDEYDKEWDEYHERMKVSAEKAREERKYERARLKGQEDKKGYSGYLAQGFSDTYGSAVSAVADSTPVKAAGQIGYGALEVGYGLGVGTIGMLSALGTGVGALAAKALENLNQQDLGQLLIHPKGRRKPPPVDPLARQKQPDILGVKSPSDSLGDMTENLFVTAMRGYQTAWHGAGRIGAGASFDPEFMEEIGDSPLLKREKEQVEQYDTKTRYVPLLDPIAQAVSGGEYRFRQPTLEEVFRIRDEAVGAAVPAPAIPGAGKLLSGAAKPLSSAAAALDDKVLKPAGRALQAGVPQKAARGAAQATTEAARGAAQATIGFASGVKQKVSSGAKSFVDRLKALDQSMSMENAARTIDVRSGTIRAYNPATKRVERIPDVFADNPEEYFRLRLAAEQRVLGKKFEYDVTQRKERARALATTREDATAMNIFEEVDNQELADSIRRGELSPMQQSIVASNAPSPRPQVSAVKQDDVLPPISSRRVILTPEEKAAEAARITQQRLDTQTPLLGSEPTIPISFSEPPINSAVATEAAQRAAQRTARQAEEQAARKTAETQKAAQQKVQEAKRKAEEVRERAKPKSFRLSGGSRTKKQAEEAERALLEARVAALETSGKPSGSTTIPPKPAQPQQKPRTRSELVEVQSMDPQAALRAQMEGQAATRPQVSATRQKASGAASVTSETLPNPRPQTTSKPSGSITRPLGAFDPENPMGNVVTVRKSAEEVKKSRIARGFTNQEGEAAAATGWKFRLFPSSPESQVKINDFLQRNRDLLDQAKFQDDKWTAYVGDKKTLELIAAKAKAELLDTGVAKPLVESSDLDISGTGIGARFDPRDFSGLTQEGLSFRDKLGAEFAATRRQKTGKDMAKIEREQIEKLTPDKKKGHKSFFIEETSGLTGNTGFYGSYKGLPTTRKMQFLLEQSRQKSIKFPNLQEAIDKEHELMRETFKRMDPANFYNKGGPVYASKGKLIPYQPRGTDTVPAMLTPGEFVINRKAAKQHMGLLKAINNGQNVKPQHLSFGGIVQPKYYEAGTSGSGVSGSSAVSGVLKSIGIDTSSIEAVFSNFQTYVTNFASSISQFVQASTNLGSLSAALGSLSQLNLVTPAESLRNASVSLKDASNTLTNSIGLFNTTAADLAAAISKIPPNITLTVTGSLPVTGTINVIIDGGTDLSPENSQLVQDAVFNKIGLAINSATAGGLNILQS